MERKAGGGGAKIAPSGAGATGADADTEAWKRVDGGGGAADVAAAAAVVAVVKAKPKQRLDLLLRCCNLFFHAVQDNVATGATPGLSGATLRAVAPPPSSTGQARPRRPGGSSSGSGIEAPPGLLGRESFCRFVRRTGIFDGLSVEEGGGGLLAHRVDLVWMDWNRRSDEARALGVGCPTSRTQGVAGLDPLAFCDFLIDTAKVKFPDAASVAEALELVLQHCTDASAAALAAKGSSGSGG